MTLTATKQRKLYLSGGMSGLPNLGFQKFFDAEEAWTAKGYECINPARLDEEHNDVKIYRWKDGSIKQVVPSKEFSYAAALRRDFDAIRQCDALLLLPGWQNSNGARLELQLAIELGIEILVEGCN